MFHVPNQYRIVTGRFKSDETIGNNGTFKIPSPTSSKNRRFLFILASDGYGWEHVSVSAKIGESEILIPYWNEMEYIKNIFWDQDDIVIQYHPKKEEYVNFANCLHMWRPIDIELPTPPIMLV